MKSILPWLVAVIALGAAGAFWSGGNSKTAELSMLQKQVEEMDSLRAEISELKKATTPAEELERLRRDNQELIRLRGEIGMLRKEKEQVARQLSSAQSTVVSAQQLQQQTLQQLQTENEKLRGAVQQTQQQTLASACINNLRQLDGAVQQWALENNKTAEVIPRKEDLLPYLPGQKFPACPGQGAYTLNALKTTPTCSIPGHVIPQQ